MLFKPLGLSHFVKAIWADKYKKEEKKGVTDGVLMGIVIWLYPGLKPICFFVLVTKCLITVTKGWKFYIYLVIYTQLHKHMLSYINMYFKYLVIYVHVYTSEYTFVELSSFMSC